jgi:hypothetical protein
MANRPSTRGGSTRMIRVLGPALYRRGQWIGATLVLLLTGCTASHVQTNALSATSRPVDVPCSRCAMKHYVWDSVGWRGGGRKVHHDIWNMECPDCVVRMSGIWLLIGPSHRCPDCPTDVERCPMCRAADRDDGQYPTSQPRGDVRRSGSAPIAGQAVDPSASGAAMPRRPKTKAAGAVGLRPPERCVRELTCAAIP